MILLPPVWFYNKALIQCERSSSLRSLGCELWFSIAPSRLFVVRIFRGYRISRAFYLHTNFINSSRIRVRDRHHDFSLRDACLLYTSDAADE